MVTMLDKKIITDGQNGCIRLNTLVTLDIISFKCTDGFITNVLEEDIELAFVRSAHKNPSYNPAANR